MACIGIIFNMFSFLLLLSMYFYRLTQLPNTNVSWSSIINPLVALLKRFVCGRGAMCGVNNSQMRRGKHVGVRVQVRELVCVRVCLWACARCECECGA